MLRSALTAALVVLSAQGLAAQGDAPATRVVLVPQVGAIVNWSHGSDASVMASLLAEVPVHSAWSVTGEATAALGGYATWACPAFGDVCLIPTAIRAGAAAGVVAHPVRLGALAPYVGVSGGFARWRKNEDTGVAPMASLRAGLDLQIVSAVGVRAELVRRIAWTSTPDAWPLHADVFSIGARVAIRR